MEIYEKPNFTLTEIYEDIIRTSKKDEEGLVDGGSGEGEGSDYGQWGF